MFSANMFGFMLAKQLLYYISNGFSTMMQIFNGLITLFIVPKQ